jgi:cytidine deaminase
MNKSVMIRTTNISFSYKEYETYEELDPSDQELIQKARESALNAYAPYSKFRVGAALRLESGKIVCGTNVENAAFPSGLCAERSAISNAISNYRDDKPLAIAIAALNEDGITVEPVPPCGNCRQVIAEEEIRNGKVIRVILSGNKKTFIVDSISSLLPLQFNKDNLKVYLP